MPIRQSLSKIAGRCSKRLDVDEDFLPAVGGLDEAESAVVVPGFEGSGGFHGEGDLRSIGLELSVALDAKTRGDSLSAAVTVLWVTTLVPNNQNTKRELFVPIDNRVRKVGQRMNFATIRCRCSEARMLLEQLRDSFKLIKKSPGQSDSRFPLVEPHCLCKVFRGKPVDVPIH